MLTRCLSGRDKLRISPSGSNISVASIRMINFSGSSFSPCAFVLRESRQNCRRSSSANVGLPIASFMYCVKETGAAPVAASSDPKDVPCDAPSNREDRDGLAVAFISRSASAVPRHRSNACLTFSRSAFCANLMGPLSS